MSDLQKKCLQDQKDEALYLSLAAWLRRRHGGRVQKIPLDVGASCPNRDGSLSHTGCTFCNARGSGSGLGQLGHSVHSQWKSWLDLYAASPRNKNTLLFMAYLQSFSNTYGTTEAFANVLESLKNLPGLMGLSVGTRPDCLDREKLVLLAEQNYPEVWLELGVQSCHQRSLDKIARGHNVACVAEAIAMAQALGIRVCAHLMAGLPGESGEDFLESVSFVAGLGVAGVKLHCLYVSAGTPLEKEFLSGSYQPMAVEDYIELAAKALTLLPPQVVIHRLAADPGHAGKMEDLVAPAWAARKGFVLRSIEAILVERSWFQGCALKADIRNSNKNTLESFPLS